MPNYRDDSSLQSKTKTLDGTTCDTTGSITPPTTTATATSNTSATNTTVTTSSYTFGSDIPANCSPSAITTATTTTTSSKTTPILSSTKPPSSQSTPIPPPENWPNRSSSGLNNFSSSYMRESEGSLYHQQQYQHHQQQQQQQVNSIANSTPYQLPVPTVSHYPVDQDGPHLQPSASPGIPPPAPPLSGPPPTTTLPNGYSIYAPAVPQYFGHPQYDFSNSNVGGPGPPPPHLFNNPPQPMASTPGSGSIPNVPNYSPYIRSHLRGGAAGHPAAYQSDYSFISLPQPQNFQQQKRPRRRYEEIERLYHCNYPGCTKSYGTLNHLNAHVHMQSHGEKRRPAEFREIRRLWKQQKKEREEKKKTRDALRKDRQEYGTNNSNNDVNGLGNGGAAAAAHTNNNRPRIPTVSPPFGSVTTDYGTTPLVPAVLDHQMGQVPLMHTQYYDPPYYRER